MRQRTYTSKRDWLQYLEERLGSEYTKGAPELMAEYLENEHELTYETYDAEENYMTDEMFIKGLGFVLAENKLGN